MARPPTSVPRPIVRLPSAVVAFSYFQGSQLALRSLLPWSCRLTNLPNVLTRRVTFSPDEEEEDDEPLSPPQAVVRAAVAMIAAAGTTQRERLCTIAPFVGLPHGSAPGKSGARHQAASIAAWERSHFVTFS